MTVEKLQRVMWRLRKNYPEQAKLLNRCLRRAIMDEIGTDVRTYQSNRKALIIKGWIKSAGKKKFIITNNDLTGDDDNFVIPEKPRVEDDVDNVEGSGENNNNSVPVPVADNINNPGNVPGTDVEDTRVKAWNENGEIMR